MKKVASMFALAAFLFAMNVNAQEPKQKEMLIKRTSYSADLRDKRWYESMEDFIERTIREGKYKTHTSYEKSKEVSRLIYTKSLFDNGIVENNIEVLKF